MKASGGAEAQAWSVYAWTCPSCAGVSIIMDPAGEDTYDCDDCGARAYVTGVS